MAMKKLILGISMLAAGSIGFALMVAAAMIKGYTLNGSAHFTVTWSIQGVTPIAYTFALCGVIGLVIAIIGVFSKND